MPFSAYALCATQRTGSTLLCDLLTGSGVAGRPNSFFRAQDVAYWAERWGVSGAAAAPDPAFDRAYIDAMIRAGSGATGLFGLRLMWDSVGEASNRFDRAFGGGDLAAHFRRTLGPTLFIHLSRRDKAAQAVSWVRAEQTGLWHLAADGTERERTTPPREPVFDAARLGAARATLEAADAGWRVFFDERAIKPLRLAYEDLASDPQAVLAGVLAALGRDPGIAARATPRTARIADATSASWVRQLASE